MSLRLKSPATHAAFVRSFSLRRRNSNQRGRRAATPVQFHVGKRGVVVVKVKSAAHEFAARIAGAAGSERRNEAGGVELLVLLLHPGGKTGYRLQSRRRRDAERTGAEGGIRGRLTSGRRGSGSGFLQLMLLQLVLQLTSISR